MPLDPQSEFEQARPALFSLAYRMLGTRADAEDIVQDAWLRWQSATREDIRMPKSFLMTVVARLSLDALKSAQRKRETYVGPWLPEPLLQPSGTQHVEMAETLSIAFLHLLESLTPAERAAFLMREVFDADYEEIAAALETTQANTRQLVARAKKHIAERRPRFTVDREKQRHMLSQFLNACATGETAPIMETLAEDAVLYTDGGGKVSAAINPIYTSGRIARFMTGLQHKYNADPREYRIELVEINGEPGAKLIEPAGTLTLITVELAADGRIARLFFMRNPDKIAVN